MKTWLKIAIGGTVILAGVGVILILRTPTLSPRVFGATYSSFYAERFGLDWQEAYQALFDDLGIRNIRLPAYWNEIEPAQGRYDFSRLDWQIEEAEKRNVEVILAVGRKLPRWPECHIPDWAEGLDETEQNGQLLRYIEVVVNRYKNSSAVKIWQVENEPFLRFGVCPSFSKKILNAEIELVRSLDRRPIMITDSGELSLWIPAARRSDIFGSTLYRIIWKERLGTFRYPLPPSFFRLKRGLINLVLGDKSAVIIELQGESWAKRMTYEISVDEQYVSMNPEVFRDVLAYASRSGFDTFYFWGVEWWYWLKEVENKPEMWEIAKEAIKMTNN